MFSLKMVRIFLFLVVIHIACNEANPSSEDLGPVGDQIESYQCDSEDVSVRHIDSGKVDQCEKKEPKEIFQNYVQFIIKRRLYRFFISTCKIRRKR